MRWGGRKNASTVRFFCSSIRERKEEIKRTVRPKRKTSLSAGIGDRTLNAQGGYGLDGL